MGEYLMMNKVLLKLAKEIIEPTLRKTLFMTICKAKIKCCKVVIERGSIDNLVCTEILEKTETEKVEAPNTI